MSMLTFSRSLAKSVPNCVWSQFASYHCASILLRPKDNTRCETVTKRRRSVSRNFDVKQSRPSYGREGHGQGWSGAASKREHSGAQGLVTAWETEIPALWETTRPRAQGVSSELRKLSLEDFADKGDSERPRTQRVTRDPKEERNYEMVFGVSPCLLALTQGRRKAYKLFVKAGEASHRSAVVNICEEAHRRGVQIHRVSKKDLDKMSPGRVHQGLCLQASPLTYIREEKMAFVTPKKKNTTPLWLVLGGIQDPMNLGAILRSAYFLGVDGIVSCLQNSCPLTPVVSKASSGAMEVMDIYGYNNLEGMLKLKAAEGWQVVGTVGAEVEESQIPVIPCSDFKMTKPTLLVMGGEGAGLSPELLCYCDTLVTIPAHRELHPGIESLNVSVATGILLHTLLSSRRTGI